MLSRQEAIDPCSPGTPFKSRVSMCVEECDDTESPAPKKQKVLETEPGRLWGKKEQSALKRVTLSSVMDRAASAMRWKANSTQPHNAVESSNELCPVEKKLKTLKVRTMINPHMGISLNSRVRQSPMKRA